MKIHNLIMNCDCCCLYSCSKFVSALSSTESAALLFSHIPYVIVIVHYLEQLYYVFKAFPSFSSVSFHFEFTCRRISTSCPKFQLLRNGNFPGSHYFLILFPHSVSLKVIVHGIFPSNIGTFFLFLPDFPVSYLS